MTTLALFAAVATAFATASAQFGYYMSPPPPGYYSYGQYGQYSSYGGLPQTVYLPNGTADCSYRYDQCGGAQWSGPQCCYGYNACEFGNNWYSQCLPTE